MKHRVWFSGLLLTLAGTTSLSAQEGVWKPAQKPTTAAKPADSQSSSASLGKPIAQPAPADAAGPKLITASYVETGAAPAPRPTATAPAPWTEEVAADDQTSEFGTERTPARAAVGPIVDDRVKRVAMADGATPPASTPPKAMPAAGATVPTVTAPPTIPPVGPGCGAVGCGESGSIAAVTADEVRRPRLYLQGEYLLWWTKQDKVPVLAATSTPADNGFLGNPSTQVLFGGGGLDGSARSGFRITGGYWLNDCNDEAIEFSGFYLSPRPTRFTANSSQYPVIARPFFNVNMNEEFSQLTAYPGQATGKITIDNESKLYGAEVNFKCKLCAGCNYRVDAFAGFRYIDLEESLNIREDVAPTAAAGPPFAGSTFVVNDFFSTRNQFYGGQIGLHGEYDRGLLSFEARAKLALGDTHQDILIDGNQVATNNTTGATTNYIGGLLAESTNIGRYSRDRFSVVPELDLNIGYQVMDHVRVFVGYNILYWNNVARPGGQIDRNLDVTKIPNFPVPGAVALTSPHPAAILGNTDFWVQGVNFGLEFRY